MTRVYAQTSIGGAVRHRVELTDSESQGPAIEARRWPFLTEVVTNGIFSGITNCGPVQFDKLVMTHDGTAWTITLEALEKK